MISVCSVKIPSLVKEFFCNNKLWTNPASPPQEIRQKGFLANYFTTSELEKLNKFKTFKRQMEWIAGRLSIKNIIEKNIASFYEPAQTVITTKSSGAPCLEEYPFWSISISHSVDMAVGAVYFNSGQKLGIDIEKIREPMTWDFLKVAFSHRERLVLEDEGRDLKSVYKKWTLKEAFLKYIETGFRENLTQVEILEDTIYYKGESLSNLTIKTGVLAGEYSYALVFDQAKDKKNPQISFSEFQDMYQSDINLTA